MTEESKKQPDANASDREKSKSELLLEKLQAMEESQFDFSVIGKVIHYKCLVTGTAGSIRDPSPALKRFFEKSKKSTAKFLNDRNMKMLKPPAPDTA